MERVETRGLVVEGDVAGEIVSSCFNLIKRLYKSFKLATQPSV